MGAHYERIKESIGLKDMFDNSDSDGETEKIFSKLRPQSPFRFKDLIKNNFDPKKFNRMIGKADKRLSHEQVKDVILYNMPIEQQSKKVLDKQNFADLHENMRLMQNYVQDPTVRSQGNNTNLASGSNNQSKRMLSFKQRPMTAPTNKSGGRYPSTQVSSQNAFFQISRGNYQFENHKNGQPSTNVSSMRDIHKMYEPPIPRHLIPTNNPFYNKQLIQKKSSQIIGMHSGLGSAATLMDNSTAMRKKKTSPRSLLSWINSPNTKRVQQKMANRISYLQFLSQNKNSLVQDVAVLEQNDSGKSKLLMLAEDPKAYGQAIEEYRADKEDHMFQDKYIISDKTINLKRY